MTRPSVAVVLTARGEPVDRLERALASALAQDYDGAIELIVALAPGDAPPAVGRIVRNPTGARSAGLNLAVAAASSEFVVRLDARSVLPVDYVSRCVGRLEVDARVGVAGGVQYAQTYSTETVPRGIARALRNHWATGGAAYRRVGAHGAVDTVYLGVFRRDELLELGGWNEALAANEDFELCQRFRDVGLLVWLEAGVVVPYEPRREMASLGRQYVAFGRSKMQYWRRTGQRPGPRQLLPLVAVPLVLLTTLRRPRLLVAAAVAVAVVDEVADPHERDVRVRVVSCLAYVPIVGGWVAGVVAEAVRLR